MMNQSAKLQQLAQLGRVFTPSAPISQRDLFAGRLEQVMSVIGAIGQPGRQVVIYGERGVGKTSLANLITQLAFSDEQGQVQCVRVNCSTNDDFIKIWRRVFKEADMDWPDEWSGRTPEPDDIRRELQRHRPFIVVLDEFDRFEDDESLSQMADLIKAVSDYALETKIVIVGVGSSISQLIGEHESIQRALEEVLLPRMDEDEMRAILDNGARATGISFDSTATTHILRIAEGLPTFVHLLALAAGKRCLADDRDVVTSDDVEQACHSAAKSHMLLSEYTQAVQSSRTTTLFESVLTACALAKKNPLGQFTARAVQDPLNAIVNRHLDIAAFAPHLKAFTAIDRGSVLVQEGIRRRFTYRFRNPLLQPFTILAAMANGLIPDDYLRVYFGDDVPASDHVVPPLEPIL